MNELALRPYREADFDRACSIRGLESEESRKRFHKGLSASGTWGEHYLHLAIDLDGELVGDVQLRKCDATRPQGAWEMGLDIAPELHGRGFGTTALRLVAEYAFSNGAHRVEGSTDESNVAMRRAFEKSGWKFEGVLKALFVEDGTPHDYFSFAITKFD
ncbi:acetyltransferase [Candidatus Planktophila dulcis]|jgi:RimJ/RimL family protein N-acetyltransferase|uniref:GNAT family N-acetyltransferase n=1 Tax=Candidatus Planktophila dulcis TaxID=1884914 RepID=UPI000BAC9407|nr:GNAT family protein [Candidatus Planktophila dulcis]ASY14288.1 acetyltransferase [Candidatus Planktophila dulcis]